MSTSTGETPQTREARENRLRELFEQHANRVRAYCYRHTGAGAAQDVVSEVFLVAWRRIDEVPADALPWLLVVARNTISNRRRHLARQQRLASELAGLERASTASSGAGEIAVERRAMLAALTDLSAAEREAVLLTGWDGLTVGQAAAVAGCSRRAFELRLHRARNRLRRLLDPSSDGDEQPAPPPAAPSTLRHITREPAS